MSLVNSAFTVNVTPGAMPPIVHVSEYDVGRTYTVTINGENGNAFNIPTGTTATIERTLNGSVGFTQSATISNNQVSFALSESMTAYSGKAWCKIKLTLNDEPIQTCAFVLVVDRAGVEAETVIGAPGFTDVIDDAVENYMEQRGVDVDPEQLAQAVDDYFDEHPVVVDETDPTVPAWAKQPTKPTYTAQEIMLEYQKMPETLGADGEEVTDDYEFEVDEESCEAMPFYVAAQCLFADLMIDYHPYLEEWEKRRMEIRNRGSMNGGVQLRNTFYRSR